MAFEIAFNDKVALVTGASRGIGQAIALSLGSNGAQVIGTATTQAGADKISAEFEKQGIKGRGMMLNVTDKQQTEQVLANIKDEVGAISILVNNAAITRDNLLLRMTDEEWSDIIDTNLSAVFRLTRSCLRDMFKQRWGRIINITSVVGFTGNPGQANYCAAKAGLVGFTKALGQEVASRNITANLVAPGFIATDMTKDLPDVHQDALLKMIPMKRMGEPKAIADSVTFLASDNADYITGQTIHVNGGMFMG